MFFYVSIEMTCDRLTSAKATASLVFSAVDENTCNRHKSRPCQISERRELGDYICRILRHTVRCNCYADCVAVVLGLLAPYACSDATAL